MGVVYKAEDALPPVTPRYPPGIGSRVAVTPSHYSCAMNPPRCAI